MNRVQIDRQGFTRINDVLLSPHTDEDGPHLRGGLYVYRQPGSYLIPGNYDRADELLPCAKLQPPLLGVPGRAGWTVRVELADAERLIARQLPVPIEA